MTKTNFLSISKEQLLRAFIKFYGVNESEYIKSQLENPKTMWYEEVDDPEKITDIWPYIKTDIPKEEVEGYLKQKNKYIFLQSAYIDDLDLLVLPKSGNINHIIHEMNHKLSSHIIREKPYAAINGLSIAVETVHGGVVTYNNNLNEVINELMTLDIISWLNIMGENVSPCYSWQSGAFKLIQPFYEFFKEPLKQLYITGNMFDFLREVGEQEFQDFTNFIERKLFIIKIHLRNNKPVTIKEEDVAESQRLTQAMIEYNLKSRK